MLHTDESRKMTSYEWLCPVTEDWCMLKLTGKVLRNALWGGGLKTSQRNMATKQTLLLYTQWQDINLLLLVTYVALMRKATGEYMKTTCEDSIRYKGTQVWAWIRKLAYVTYTYMYLHKHLLFDLETGL